MSHMGSLLMGSLMVWLATGCGDGQADGGVDGGVIADGNVGDMGTPDSGREPAPPGSACDCDTDCQAVDGHEAICVMGICLTLASAECSEAGSRTECGEGSRCWGLAGFYQSLCWPDCSAYDCAGECDSDGSCVPTADTACDPACGTVCGGDTDFDCSPEHPFDGDCPWGAVCRDGACVPFSCNDTVMEPNETRGDAVAFSESTGGLQICADDRDWFSFTPTEESMLHVVGVRSHYGSGDLDVELRSADDEVMTQAWLRPNSYHEENGRGPVEFEGYSVHGAAAAGPFLLQVFGIASAANDYELVYDTIPWRDAASCIGAGFTETQCSGASEGSFRTSELLMFPVGHTEDPFVGAGFTSLSGFDGASYIPTSAQWGRRDLIMAVRYAMHVVQEAFPGTAPLGIGDIGMPDGTTPAGHPNYTHHYGSSADIAYFIRPEADRGWGQLTYRQICNDAPTLRDWSCVDTDGSRGQFGECVTGCGDGHIVDIPRTARFLAAIAESGRLEVYGVDTAVDDELDAELATLETAGVAGAAAARSRMATADDHSSWVWHFNHMHLAFE